MTKIFAVLRYVKTLPHDYLVLVVDAYDVFACGPPRKLVKRYKRFGGVVVAGTHFSSRSVNGGFYRGKAMAIRELLECLLSSRLEDDQEALAYMLRSSQRGLA